MSASVSIAMSRSASRTRAQYAVCSRAVSAFDSPPTLSKATAISRAERLFVPLNRRCSRKCVDPAVRGPSSREPTGTHRETPALFVAGIVWVRTRVPAPRIVRSMRVSPSSIVRRASSSGSGLGVILLLLHPVDRD